MKNQKSHKLNGDLANRFLSTLLDIMLISSKNAVTFTDKKMLRTATEACLAPPGSRS